MPAPRSPLTLPPELEDQARDLLCRVQAALGDEHRAGALRGLRALHQLVVPALDLRLRVALGRAAEGALSSGVGLLGLWDELLDLDVERAGVAGLLIRHAADFEDGEGDEAFCLLPGQEQDAADGEARQWAALEGRLLGRPMPARRWWRRMRLQAAGPFGDRARALVQRGALVVLDRPPASPASPASIEKEGAQETALGAIRAGDRLTLQVQVPLPGRLGVLHAAHGDEDEGEAELEVLFPLMPAEEAPRRALEVVEIAGEVAALPGAREQSLVVLWAPELVPPSWVYQGLARGRLLPEVRVWRYRYEVGAEVTGPTPDRA